MRTNLIQEKQFISKGFSLIEVMIAFMLIGVGALGLVKLQVYVEQRANFAIHSLEALNLAEQQLEWFRTKGASPAFSTVRVANFTTDIVTGSALSEPPFYTLQWTITENMSFSSLKSIYLVVSWRDRENKNQSISLQTMLSEYSEFDESFLK